MLFFISKGLLVLKIFKLLSKHFGHVAKRLDKKDKAAPRTLFVCRHPTDPTLDVPT